HKPGRELIVWDRAIHDSLNDEADLSFGVGDAVALCRDQIDHAQTMCFLSLGCGDAGHDLTVPLDDWRKTWIMVLGSGPYEAYYEVFLVRSLFFWQVLAFLTPFRLLVSKELLDWKREAINKKSNASKRRQGGEEPSQPKRGSERRRRGTKPPERLQKKYARR